MIIELHRALLERGVDSNIVAPMHFNRHLVGVPRVWGYELPGVLAQRGHGRVLSPPSRLAEGQALRRLIRPDTVVHETHFRDDRHRVRAAAPMVVFVYDMTPELMPDVFPMRNPTPERKRASVRRAAAVMVPSESTRRDLCSLLDVPEEKVHVVPLATAIGGSSEQSAEATRPFLLYVGVRESYKNFAGLVGALGGSRTTVDLVAFGGPPLGAEELALVHRAGLDGRVRWEAGDDRRLAELYRGALALVYPSQYEGFGLPILEAMTLGCPVICSNTSSMPEVAGSAAEYVDPASSESIRMAIDRVVGDPIHRQRLVDLGRIRADEFSWARTAEIAEHVYASVLG